MATPLTNRTPGLTLKVSQAPESSFQKLKEQAPSKILCDTVITEKLLESLCDKSIKTLELVNCTMTENVANILATSKNKEKVIFKKCILSDLKKDQIIDMGVWKVGDETAIFNPNLMQLAEDSSRLSEELLKWIDAPVIFTKSKELLEKEITKEITYTKELIAFVHKDILPTISDFLENPPPRTEMYELNDVRGLKERIFACIAAVDSIIARYNKSTDHPSLLLDLITRENQTFTDVLYNGTQRGKHASINHPYLIFDGDSLGPAACISHVLATTYLWGREP